jgi:hypothetical protein
MTIGKTMMQDCDEPPTLSTAQYVNAIAQERDKWIEGRFNDLHKRVEDLQRNIENQTERDDKLFERTISEIDRQITTLHTTIIERLLMKDRWLDARFLDVEKLRDADLIKTKELSEANMRWADEVITQLNKSIAQEIDNTRQRVEQHRDSHAQLHAIHEKTLEELKQNIFQRLEVSHKALEAMREERGGFISREQFDVRTESLEKQIDTIERSAREGILAAEKQTREMIETAVSRIESSLEPRIKANAERLDKIERNIQVQDARNRQSIIALGVILTIVELFIRFYAG